VLHAVAATTKVLEILYGCKKIEEEGRRGFFVVVP
jgi:hypothetical protein